MSEDRIDLRFDSFRSFLEACSDRISEEGIFLATEEIRPVGSTVEFHLGLASDFPLLRGSGEVVWVVEPDGGEGTPGMAVRYQSTDQATTHLVHKIAERQRAGAGSVFEVNRAAGELAAAAGGDAVAEPPPAPERSPSLATQAVDALIGDAIEPAAAAETESEPEAKPEAAPEPVPEPLPVVPPAAVEAPTAEEMETEPSPKRSRRGLWAALALIAALAGAAYWQRDLLRDKLAGAPADPAPAPVGEPQPVDVAEPVVQAPAEPSVQAPVEPAMQAPAEPAPESGAEPGVDSGAPTPAPAQAAPPPVPSGPLTRIEEVRWRSSVGVTMLELVADGAFAPDGYSLERLEDPPRVLLKISGVTTPLPSPTLAVGSEEVVGVRTGLHGSPPATSLHVVVDLADPTAQVTAAEVVGAVLQLRVASSAISP